ncbi:Hypothetical protein R9X50_00596700 [Acrodontium crateriforme]|uniref:Nuclear speckle splicing regulatory protein 1 N-terminal domain-containing protein n=1 Tax=Acrodontium crateriforme TaxID=150365 RepID=A0AAQ3MCZ8_9PEZI|nr:Hypothetical protein R9X50_00596700 [Acrodontium crateriforme]
MLLKHGLNVKSKTAPAPVRRTLLDDDDDDEENDTQDQIATEEITSFGGNPRQTTNSQSKARQPLGKPKLGGLPPPPSRRKPEEIGQDLSSIGAAQVKVKEAQELDASIFDYDSFHDAKTSVSEAKKKADRQDAVERKPKYINNLLDAASRRKQDQLIAREKLLQKEREAEGDEFADKEKFVTGAYKKQQEEARRLEEEEKKKAEEEEKRKRQLGGGMQGFYKTMMDQNEKKHQETMEAAAKIEQSGGVKKSDDIKIQTDVELAAEMKAKGINVHLNEDGQLVDKRELLTAGLNVVSSGKGGDKHGSDHLKATNRPAQTAFPSRGENQQATRERQTRMMEEQLAARAKRAREEEEEEKARLEKAAKTSKTEKDVSDAKARYLARKAAKERGET